MEDRKDDIKVRDALCEGITIHSGAPIDRRMKELFTKLLSKRVFSEVSWLRRQKLVTPDHLFWFAWEVMSARKRATNNPLQDLNLNFKKNQMTFVHTADKLLNFMEEHRDSWMPDGIKLHMGEYRDPAKEHELEDFEPSHDQPEGLEQGSMLEAMDAINESVEEQEAEEATENARFEAAIEMAGDAAFVDEINQMTIGDRAAGYSVPVESSDEEEDDDDDDEDDEEEGEEGEEQEDVEMEDIEE
ncbi:hypothetical protein PFICI_05130 [Pestalotiopsis fici W106-1]|uniref:Uncharacterized protein n=1 Tax=Pestalotiopsis fici (strain W106-1 / CGMCC3.15140) TaxID=1229662 RepID=W3XB69_PESFW|nr:uncharacterized protein PFICI_05130 [Pestalotiopsis fici W106-1]ETS83254.1 hypothetical protein PFICI_05130 [Pestalotiopsis fici W106-1]